jgi:hypothetical protein
MRKRVALGVDGVAAKNSFNFYQNHNNSHEELINDDVLVERARRAVELAERRGDDTVEMGEMEWKAWQRHLAIEAEVERRVAERLERLEVEKRGRVTIPIAPSRVAANSLGAVGGPGILTGDGFVSLEGVPRASTAQLYPDPVDDREPTAPMSPPSFTGAFPDSPESVLPPRPLRSAVRPVPSPSSSQRSDFRSSPVSTQGRDLSPQPGSSYYPGRVPSLTSRSETGILGFDNEADASGSTLSVRSDEAFARRRKREELRKQLDL